MVVENFCGKCNKACAGEVLFAHGEYYHQDCFKCKACLKNLFTYGFYTYEDEFYCTSDYQKMFGINCRGCGKLIEGEAVTIMEDSYHQDCFYCAGCRTLFPAGANISFDGQNYLCDICIQEAENEANKSPDVESNCAGCGNEIKNGQALLALDSQWHLWCFTCHKCGCLLSGEYMGRDGVPYCEKDYQDEFGVTCAGCGGYITGKVLQAGEKHYHPQCSRCAKCDQMFGEGEEMYLQGSEIWHPECSDAYQRDAEENARNAYQNSLEEQKPEPKAQPPPVQPKPVSPPPEETPKEDIISATRDYMQNVFRKPSKEEKPPEPDPVESPSEDVEQATKNYVEKPYQAPVKEQKSPEPKIDWRKSLKKVEPLKNERVSPKPDDISTRKLSSSNDALSTYSARPFETPKTTPGSISINFKPKASVTIANKWKPPEPKTTPPAEEPKTRRTPPEPKATSPTEEPKSRWKPPEPKTAPPTEEPKIRRTPPEPKTTPPTEEAKPRWKPSEPKTDPPKDEPKFRRTPPEPKTSPPTEEPKKISSLYRPSRTVSTDEPARTSFKRSEPPKTTVKTEITTKYSFKKSTDEKRATSPPVGKEEPAAPISNGIQKTPSVSSDEGAPARPPPPPTRGSSQHWKSRISLPADSVKRATSPPTTQETAKAKPTATISSGIDVRSSNRPMSYIDSASKRDTHQTETKRTTTNITIKSVSTSSEDAPLPNALYRRNPPSDRAAARENRKSMPSMSDAVDNKPVTIRVNGPARTEAKVMNRRSLPSMDKLMDEQARKSYPVYPYSVLKSSNYKMPKDVDKSCLEAYLAEEEFEDLFRMEKDSFYKLPAWKQRDLKKKVSLF